MGDRHFTVRSPFSLSSTSQRERTKHGAGRLTWPGANSSSLNAWPRPDRFIFANRKWKLRCGEQQWVTEPCGFKIASGCLAGRDGEPGAGRRCCILIHAAAFLSVSKRTGLMLKLKVNFHLSGASQMLLEANSVRPHRWFPFVQATWVVPAVGKRQQLVLSAEINPDPSVYL